MIHDILYSSRKPIISIKVNPADEKLLLLGYPHGLVIEWDVIARKALKSFECPAKVRDRFSRTNGNRKKKTKREILILIFHFFPEFNCHFLEHIR
jgi:hypothetical protein